MFIVSNDVGGEGAEEPDVIADDFLPAPF